MRFIGNKKDLLKEIETVIQDNVHDDSNHFLDLFAGSGSVGNYFKKDFKVTSNDNLYFSYCVQKTLIELNEKPAFEKLRKSGISDPLNYLMEKDYKIDQSYFIYHNYSPSKDCDRMYFTNDNAARIDFIRQKIESWNDENLITNGEYYYLITVLIFAVQKVANTTGTYGAFLKTWDNRAFNSLSLKDVEIFDNKEENKAYNQDVNKLIQEIEGDILYLDPPYNGRQYFSNYHLLETIAKYDNPEIKGKTGLRKDTAARSDFSLKTKAYRALDDLIAQAKAKHLIFSYSSDGILSKEEIEEILKKHGFKSTYKLYEISYRKYKSVHKQKKDQLFEYIFYIQLKNKHDRNELIKSPLNYIGGKYDLLKQILPLFPEYINTFVDLFAGGYNVGVNIDAKKIILNDMNHFVVELLESLKKTPTEDVLKHVYGRIQACNLSKENESGFKKFRDHYNQNKNPLDLYTLVCYSFNYQFRFNSKLDYNNPFGRNRSHFSKNMEKRLIKFSDKLKSQNIEFSSEYFEDFNINELKQGDFVYCDPPYLITTGSYNDGSRGFKDWTKESDKALFKLLDELDKNNVKFALSNVFKHKGKTNNELIEWSKKYKVHYLNKDYSNASYNTRKGESIEVLITNY